MDDSVADEGKTSSAVTSELQSKVDSQKNQ